MSYQDRLRYVIKYGKYGAYFYDKDTGISLTLKHVERILNRINEEEKE